MIMIRENSDFTDVKVDRKFNESMKAELSRVKIQMKDLTVNEKIFGDKYQEPHRLNMML